MIATVVVWIDGIVVVVVRPIITVRITVTWFAMPIVPFIFHFGRFPFGFNFPLLFLIRFHLFVLILVMIGGLSN